MLKHFILGIMLVTLVGCGCGDSPPTTTLTGAGVTQFKVRTSVPPCAVPYTPSSAAQPIDIVFVMDDSLFMNAASGMGVVPKNNNDNRSRSLVAQRIFGDLQARLKTAVAARQAAGTLPAGVTFDFAYSVVRYEDFGGETVSHQGTPNATSPTPNTIDAGARPYILNMPLLREARLDFQVAFNAALARTATDGDGNPTVSGILRQDPQTAFEALWQIATGDGFDGDGDTNTRGNGLPCSADAQGTAFKVFKDVPAVQFARIGVDPQNPDWSEYAVRGDDGNSEAGCISSGNLGGVGFRPDSLRYVILASDIATVAPFEDAGGTPELPADTDSVFGIGTPAAQIPAPAFDGITGRYGAAVGGPASVAPMGAASVQETIARLNELGIEVLCLGAPGVQPGPVKPNLPGATPGSEIEAILAPATPAFTPFTFQSALSKLTGSQISDDTPGGLLGLFPAVFNLGNVGLLNPGASDPLVPTSFATTVTDDLLDGMLERIAAKATAGGTGTSGPIPQLPTLTLNVMMQVDDSGFTQPIQRNAPVASNTVMTTVVVPVYYQDTLDPTHTFFIDGAGNEVSYNPPAEVPVELPDWAFSSSDPDNFVAAVTDLAPFSVMITGDALTSIGNRLPGVNDDAVAFLESKLKPEIGVTAVGQGVMEITIHPSPMDPPLPRGMVILPGYTGWCLTLQDTTWPSLANFTEETVGVCTGLFGTP